MSNEIPMVSVIIPNYNHARYLRERIDSVLLQTYQDFELIILDDCSQDDSKSIIEEYAYIYNIKHVVFNDHNSGSTFKQWKKGIELAQGEWIWIAESDDWCDKELLGILLLNAQKNKIVTVSYCQSYYRVEGSMLIQDMSFHTDCLSTHHWKEDYISNGIDEIRNYLLYRNTIPNASAVIFKKSAYTHADKSFDRMKLCGDWMFWVQLLKFGDVSFCSKPLNNFRAHNLTTRVLDTLNKKRLRLEEEYIIAMDIKNTFQEFKLDANARINDIIAEYSLCFESNKVFIFPYLYTGHIPYIKVLSCKLKRLFRF